MNNEVKEYLENEVVKAVLRDLFAGLAMLAIHSNPSIDTLSPDEVSSDAYNVADAMLERRGMRK